MSAVNTLTRENAIPQTCSCRQAPPQLPLRSLSFPAYFLGRPGPRGCAATGHEQPKPRLIAVRRLEAHDPALVHHRDPVRKRTHLIELRRHQQDGGAFVSLLDPPSVAELDGPDVDAPRRLRGKQDLGVARHLPRNDDLLLVSARKRP